MHVELSASTLGALRGPAMGKVLRREVMRALLGIIELVTGKLCHCDDAYMLDKINLARQDTTLCAHRASQRLE